MLLLRHCQIFDAAEQRASAMLSLRRGDAMLTLPFIFDCRLRHNIFATRHAMALPLASALRRDSPLRRCHFSMSRRSPLFFSPTLRFYLFVDAIATRAGALLLERYAFDTRAPLIAVDDVVAARCCYVILSKRRVRERRFVDV